MASKFSIRSVLLLMAIVALVCFVLVRPSKWWLLPIAPVGTGFVVVVVYWGMNSAEYRAASLSFVAGMTTYLGLALFIQIGFQVWDEEDVWWSMVGPLWSWLHGKIPIDETVNGYEREDYLSFVIISHIVFAVVTAAATAAICQACAIKCRRNDARNRLSIGS